MAAELNFTRRRARHVEQATTARLPGSSLLGPGATVPTSAPAAQDGFQAGDDTSWFVEGQIRTTEANFASEWQVLPHALGSMW